MKTGDLITSYLDNEMSPEQEREFLLSVAASDSLRLALKSHVMLDRIVTRQAQQVQVPGAIRDNIFAQMSASVAATPHAGPAGRAASHFDAGTIAAKSAGSIGQSILKMGRGAIVMAMTACGFATGYYVHSQLPEMQRDGVVAPTVQQTAPAVTTPSAEDIVPGVLPAPSSATHQQQSAPSRSGRSIGTISAASVRTARSAGSTVPTTSGNRTGSIADEPSSKPSGGTDTPMQSQKLHPSATPSSVEPNPLDPPASSHAPTVTSGAPSSSESQPASVSATGTIRNSNGSDQHMAPKEDPK